MSRARNGQGESRSSLCYRNSRLIRDIPFACRLCPFLYLGSWVSPVCIFRPSTGDFQSSQTEGTIENGLDPRPQLKKHGLWHQRNPQKPRTLLKLTWQGNGHQSFCCLHFTPAWGSSSPCMCPSMVGRRGSPQTQTNSCHSPSDKAHLFPSDTC